MRYILTGFTHDHEFRVFAFEGIADDHNRSNFTVRVDLGKTRTYGIRPQELPLLCRCFLEESGVPQSEGVTFPESKMRQIADTSAEARAAAARLKPPPRRPVGSNAASPWRNTRA